MADENPEASFDIQRLKIFVCMRERGPVPCPTKTESISRICQGNARVAEEC